MWSSFAYHEPSTAQILTLSSFLVLLNLFGWGAQALLSAGLLGQILIGIIFGTPVAGWIDRWEETFVALGYVGLLLVVYEGGLQSNMSHLASVLPLAVCVALMGVLAPMALSFLLVPIADFSHQHAFAAGSSLVSTSLGTVLAILHPAAVGFDLHKSKLGATLFSAAILDDVVAFVIAKVLTTVGGGGGSIGAGVGRTVGVTIGLGLVLGALTRFVLRPVYTQWLANKSNNILLCAHVPLFVGLVAAAGYAGTSPLYGAYSAGLAVAYISHNEEKAELSTPETNLITVFEDSIAPLLSTLLLPIFFGSIGFSIPFVALWRGAIIWRGVVYAVFMAFGKLLCSVVILAWMGPSAWRGAVLVGAAMVARGEIGLLISQIARHTPTPLLDEEEFLIVVWAVMLCTLVGPLGVGFAIRKWGSSVLRGGFE